MDGLLTLLRSSRAGSQACRQSLSDRADDKLRARANVTADNLEQTCSRESEP